MDQTMYIVSSLEKVFSDTRPLPYTGKFSMLRKDRLSFQAAFFAKPVGYEPTYVSRWSTVKVDSPLAKWIRLYHVKEMPSRLPAFAGEDGNYLRTEPGLFPDLLEPATDVKFRASVNHWNAIWVEIASDEETPAGEFPITLTLTMGEGHEVRELTVSTSVEVIPAALPEQALIHTEWFHSDCVADFYHVDVFSEEHWALLEGQIACAAEYGINALLTPVFTQPLDTAVGGERTTVQLVDVVKEGENYSFGFEKLDRWVELCRRCGIKYFEIAHLYTQWGAEHCPKIMATVDGEYKKLFGWESDAVGEEYRGFLNAFLPALTARMETLGVDKEHVLFHISDEPGGAHLAQYNACKAQVAELLKGYTIMDALSDFDFYQKGVCEHPVVASNHVTPFLEHHVPDLWVYYCCGQGYKVSNRFFGMPSARNRIIGTQFYKYNVAGFLQWGFNFYNAQLSMYHIDPFAVTDADGAFPSGDAFVVYPGPDGTPWKSLRLLTFNEALNDLRAFRLLESFTSREFVMDLLEGDLSGEITFFDYPQDAAYLLNLRQRVNQEIKARLK